MGQGDVQVVIEGPRDAALGRRKGRRHGRAVASGVLVVRIQAPDVVRLEFGGLGGFVGRAESGGRRILRILGDVTGARRPEEDIDRVRGRPQDGAYAVFIDGKRGPGFRDGFHLGDDFGGRGRFRRRLLRIFLAGAQDQGQRQAGKQSCFHSAGHLEQIIFFGVFIVVIPAGDQEGRIVPDDDHSRQGSGIRAAQKRIVVRIAHRKNNFKV